MPERRALAAKTSMPVEDPAFLGLELRFGQRTGIPQNRQGFESLEPDTLAVDSYPAWTGCDSTGLLLTHAV